jgi:hypothetical protein
VNVDSIRVDRHTDEIDPIHPDRGRQTADLTKLRVGESAVEAEFTGRRAHLDHDPLPTEPDDQVDLAGPDRRVPIHDDRPTPAQDRRRHRFAHATEINTPFATLHDALCTGRV